MLIFGARGLLSLKICQMCPQNSFSRFSRKINAAFLAPNLWLKKVIFIFGVRWPLIGRTATQRSCCNARVGLLQPLLLRFKICISWLTACVTDFLGRGRGRTLAKKPMCNWKHCFPIVSIFFLIREDFLEVNKPRPVSH